MPNIVFARVTGTASWNGQRIRLAEDDPWNADDPFVVAHPQHFRDLPLRLFGHQGAQLDVIEQASAAPGEKRNVRRTKSA